MSASAQCSLSYVLVNYQWRLVRLERQITIGSVLGKSYLNQRAYKGEGFSALFTFCPNCPAIISPRILGKIGAVVGVPRACQKFWGFFCLVVCSSLPDGSGRLMEGPTWQTQNVNKAEKHTPKVDAACLFSVPG